MILRREVNRAPSFLPRLHTPYPRPQTPDNLVSVKPPNHLPVRQEPTPDSRPQTAKSSMAGKSLPLIQRMMSMKDHFDWKDLKNED